MVKKMVAKGLPLPQSHRDAISRGLKRYHSMNEMSQEQKDRIANSQKKRLAKRDKAQIQAHKDAVSKGTRKYYETHDVPWKGQTRNDEFKNKVSEGLKRAYENGLTNWNANIELSQSHKDNISKSLVKTWKTKDKKPRSESVRNKISESLRAYWKNKKQEQ
jgi:hypothetical protein